MAEKLSSTDIGKIYYRKKHEKARQIKLDAPNLYLWVSKSGSCVFRFKLYLAKQGSCSWVTLGSHPEMTIHVAKEQAFAMKSKRDNGINPNQEKREHEIKNKTLSDFIDSYIDIQAKVRKLATSTTTYRAYLFNIIKEQIGKHRLQDITHVIIYNKLIKQYVDDDKLPMANRFRIILKQVFDYAVKQDLIIKNPVLALDTYYQPKDAHERNLYLTEIELKDFLISLYQANITNTAKYYLHLLTILGIRKSELYNATWDDIDFETNVFTNYQIKTKKTNKIPLSSQAIIILQRLKSISKGDKYIVVNSNTVGQNKPVATNYFNNLLNRIEFNKSRNGNSKVSPHDFRRVLSTLANESELFDPLYIEMALGHETRTELEKGYNKSAVYLKQKREIFDWIANKVDELINDKSIYDLLVVL